MTKNRKTKILLTVIILIVILAGAIKIHSFFFYPNVVDRNYYQLQKIDKDKNYFSFDVFGDNKNSNETFEDLINKINKDDVSFAIDIGDLVYDGDISKYAFFLNQIKRVNKPFLTVIGNHGIKEEGRANYYDIFGRFYYSFSIGNNYFIILDDSNEKNIDPWQMSWLKKELIKSEKYKNRLVFMHVPLFDPRKGDRVTGHSLKDTVFAKKLNDLFDNYKVTMVFASHIHGYFTGYWSKTPFIITGGAGAELVGTNPNHYFYHYIKVTISKHGIDYKVVKLKTPGDEFFDRLRYDLWIYIYAYFKIHFWDIIFISGLLYLIIYLVFVRKKWLVVNIKKGKK